MPTLTLLEAYRRARDDHERAIHSFVPSLVKMAMATIIEVLPTCDQIEVLGDVNEDLTPTLRIQRVLDANRAVLFDVDTGHDRRDVEDAIDEVNIEYLDPLADLTGDAFMGEQTIDLSTAQAW